MHGNQLIEISFIDNYSWEKLPLNLIEEVAGLQQEEYTSENCRGNKYFLMNLDTEVRKNRSVTKIWLCKVMFEKRGWQVINSPPLNPSLDRCGLTWILILFFESGNVFLSFILLNCWLNFKSRTSCTLSKKLLIFEVEMIHWSDLFTRLTDPTFKVLLFKTYWFIAYQQFDILKLLTLR